MPIYEYQCAACGHELEKLQKLSDAPLKDCPACGERISETAVSCAECGLEFPEAESE